MKAVVLKPLHHREQECIGIYFDNSPAINSAIRNNAGAKWSQTKKCWYVPLSKENYTKLYLALKGRAEIDQTLLHQYLAAKKKKPATQQDKEINTAVPVIPPAASVVVSRNTSLYKTTWIQHTNAHVLPRMREYLKLKAYSPSTIRTYLQEMSHLLGLLKNIPADELTTEHLKRYMLYCAEEMKLKENSLHSRINARKFYYEQVLKREKFF